MKKILITATKALLYFVGWTLLVSFIPVPDFENPAIWRFAAELIPFLCIIGISILFWLIEKRSVKIFSLFNPIRNCLIGIVSGIAWLGLSFCIMSLSGVLKITQVNLVSMLWLWILSAFINTIMQELLVRGYLYQMIKTKHNIIAATIVSTALFTFMHGGAFEAGIIPVLNVLTMSLLMTVVLEYTQSLLTPIIMHFLWNSVGAIVLGGVSLADDYPNLLTKGLYISDDLKTEEVEAGVATLEFTLNYTASTRNDAKQYGSVGNYILRKNGDEQEFYTIISSEENIFKQEVEIYAEDAGMDLLNETVGEYKADKAYPASYYVEKFSDDSGFEIGINEVSNYNRKLSWEGETTASERILSVATQFDAEVSYTFEIDRLKIKHKYINLHKKRGVGSGARTSDQPGK